MLKTSGPTAGKGTKPFRRWRAVEGMMLKAEGLPGWWWERAVGAPHAQSQRSRKKVVITDLMVPQQLLGT